nr:hypothetical protein [Tanacetum cinerariifolium]
MDNRGTPTQVNLQIRRCAAYKKIQDPSECWPFGAICEYTPIMDLSCRVPLSNRRGKRIVEALEPSTTRRNTEAGNVVDVNNRANTYCYF